MTAAGCGAPAGGHSGGGTGEAVIEGLVTKTDGPAATGYARLLNSDGEFVAEVPLGTDGGFRFFAAPGSWTVRVLAPGGVSVDRVASAATGQIARVDLSI